MAVPKVEYDCVAMKLTDGEVYEHTPFIIAGSSKGIKHNTDEPKERMSKCMGGSIGCSSRAHATKHEGEITKRIGEMSGEEICTMIGRAISAVRMSGTQSQIDDGGQEMAEKITDLVSEMSLASLRPRPWTASRTQMKAQRRGLD